MECQYCHRGDATGLTRISVYGEGIMVCEDCRELIDRHRHQPYSQVMERMAMLESGYHLNRKIAKNKAWG
jgi:protein-arginine kinase activator protein McsA